MGVIIKKKTMPRIRRVLTNDRPSANNIQTLLGTTNARGNNQPDRTNSTPNGMAQWATPTNFPLYSHQLPSKTKIPPTISPNSRSGRKERFSIFLENEKCNVYLFIST